MSRQTRNVRRHDQNSEVYRLRWSISKVWMESSDGQKIFTVFSCGIHQALWKVTLSFYLFPQGCLRPSAHRKPCTVCPRSDKNLPTSNRSDAALSRLPRSG